ncbi:MAG TPA: cation:proton antiporter [Gemmatimonadaceae bacterium]|nr:cation:proton antiporter [Gemmatimonadaceae bacterium]
MPHDISHLLLVLVAVIVATKLLGEVAQRFGQPAVLGELIAGVLLGGSVLGLLDPGDPVIASFSELGVIVLLFEIGLNTDLRSLARVGPAALIVALVGVALPFALGYGGALALGVATLPALVCGAALTATSIGISARVLGDLGRLETPEGQVVLGAAVLDDVVGLVILAVVSGVVAGGGVSAGGVARIAGVALGFIALAIVGGSMTVPPLFRAVERVRTSGTLGLVALAFAFALAALAARAGSAMIVGAFAAGLVLHPTPQRDEIERATTSVGHFFVPIFFAAVGAAVDLHALADSRALLVGGVLIAVGVAGKVVAGFAPWWFRGDKLLIGVAMVPRGEVGLIFAQMGLASGAISAGEFGALMLMVLATTLVTPPLLGRVSRRRLSLLPVPALAGDLPGDGGIDDLVAGTAQRRTPGA